MVTSALMGRLEAWQAARRRARGAAPLCGCGNPGCVFAELDARDCPTHLWQSAVPEFDPVRA